MNNLIKSAFVGLILVGCSYSSSLDNYEIQWNGASGSELFASYGIASKIPGKATRIEKVTGKLPHKISFTAPKNALVSASGMLMNQGTVEIKIFKNGSECGKETIIGSGAIGNKTCQ
ncbi:hypothetical protein [Nostoc sp. NMS4]|uniref:hypothetical protein n=1 Tax=Nostoc sp. NMS4 TaxID=2815390 RepID=UPI0025D31659|nr:hypothetical protein [Nostoc sp. NMS4]MBN3924010.1 hypothetical protein [Nostoc sp. NMS4]